MTPIFIGVVTGGRPIPKDVASFYYHVSQFEGKEIDIKVTRHYNKRSIQQNSYYRGVVVEYVYAALLDLGWQITNEDAHNELRNMFLTVEKVNVKTGEIKKYVRSTTELNTVEMMCYIEKIQQWAAMELHLNIPDPNTDTNYFWANE